MSVDRFISTYTGQRINLLDPQPESIAGIDIARGLSRQYRFGGHTCAPYTVAQHSVFVSELVAPELALQALLHDATEAYIGDLPSPVKALCPDYVEIEERLQAAIMKKYKLPAVLAVGIHIADRIALATEKRDLLPFAANDEWQILKGVEAHPHPIGVSWDPNTALMKFLHRLGQLTRARAAARAW